jgi:hypothetical protein
MGHVLPAREGAPDLTELSGWVRRKLRCVRLKQRKRAKEDDELYVVDELRATPAT